MMCLGHVMDDLQVLGMPLALDLWAAANVVHPGRSLALACVSGCLVNARIWEGTCQGTITQSWSWNQKFALAIFSKWVWDVLLLLLLLLARYLDEQVW